MLVPTNPLIITSFTEQNKTAENINNSLKIDLSKIADYKSTHQSNVVFCKKQACQAAFSLKDHDTLLTPADYHDNYALMDQKNRLSLAGFDKNTTDHKVWICRFCGLHQLIPVSVKGIDGPQKFILSGGSGSSKQQEPIILFVIDSSSSMDEHVFDMSKRTDAVTRELLSLVQHSELAQKSRQKEAQYLKKISKKYGGGDVNNKKFVTKKYLLLGLMQKVLRQISYKVKSQVQQNLQRKVGFLFFNENVYLLGDGTSKTFPIIHDKNYNIKNFDESKFLQAPVQKQRFDAADFYSFTSLFQVGAKHANLYNTQLTDIDTSRMDLSDICMDGKTALGPALAIATGIVSKHGQGSSIVVVTDGQANYGVLEADSSFPDVEKQLLSKLHSMKCVIGFLQWRPAAQQLRLAQKPLNKLNPSNYFNQFVQKDKDFLVKYNLTLSVDEETIKLHSDCLEQLALRRVLATVNQIRMVCSTDLITFEKSQFQTRLLTDLSLIVSGKSFWVNLKLDKQRITEDDYYNPVYTQCILKYNDVSNKQYICFVSEVEQVFSKSVKKIISLNFDNVQEYIDQIDFKNYTENNTIRSIERTIRQTFRDASASIRSKGLDIQEIRSNNEYVKRLAKRI